ncbi:caspase-7-like [Eublepharis macularius]|uniref:Caspase-7-like n=1 Tax=Eublepharis macularius TaxID=481883 RepID=A0AA97KBJ0_EUBMA|nr:caspase-7-like [Eublepharis macularius]
MANHKKNRALLIVNYNFYRSPELRARPGAEKEAKRLFKALSACNYAVQLHYDLTAEEIQELYEKEGDADHGDYFVSILSSHGEEGAIFDCDGQPVQLTQIFHALSPQRCPKLAGKPKILFIQACRGKEIDPGVWIQTDSGELQTDSSEPQTDCFSHYLSIPEDTAVMFSCSPGYASFINQWESMFLKALLELLEGKERELELARLMTWINWRVAFHFQAKGKYSGGKEMPCFVTNMVKEVYPFSLERRLPLDSS